MAPSTSSPSSPPPPTPGSTPSRTSPRSRSRRAEMSRFPAPHVLTLLAGCLAVVAAQAGDAPDRNPRPAALASLFGTPNPTSLSQIPLQHQAPAETPGPSLIGDLLVRDDDNPSRAVIDIHATKETSVPPSNSTFTTSTTSSKNSPSKTSSSSSTTSSSASSPSPPSSTSTSTSSSKATALPTPFDNTPSSAFRAEGADKSCPNFITSLLANPTFKSCYPLSMMLQTSDSFFAAERSLPRITRVLDATCAPDPGPCAAFLSAAANNISAVACARELQRNQALVVQAYRGLRAYSVLYAATCLQDPKSSQYCFAAAVTDATAPADSYLYFLPFGSALPPAAAPSCDWCTSQTMAVYHAAAAEGQALIASTYDAAAGQVNAACGSGFVNASAPQGAPSAGASLALPRCRASLAIALASLAAPLLFML